MGIKKTPKGEISVEDFRGRIRLRWRYEGNRYTLSLPYMFLPENMHHATVKVAEIKLDIMKGCFDATLQRYRPSPDVTSPPIKPIEVQQLAVADTKPTIFLNDLVAKFNEWCRNIRNVDVDVSIDYFYIRRLFEKWVNVPVALIAEKLSASNWATSTYNRRLAYISSFLSWLVTTGIVERNPLKEVQRRRDKRRKRNPRRKPLEESEILVFLDAIKNDTYCRTASQFKHSYYHPILAFIFYTGVRNAEAIGLRVKHVDLTLKQVEISEAFARTVKGSHHAARIQKGTKMENVRYLPLTDELIAFLVPQLDNKAPDYFVFPSPRGLCIDDRMLERRVIKPVLKKLGFGDRDLYAARHSFGTRAVQQGMALTDIAYLMGHTTIETAARNYVSVDRPATALPCIKPSAANVGSGNNTG